MNSNGFVNSKGLSGGVNIQRKEVILKSKVICNSLYNTHIYIYTYTYTYIWGIQKSKKKNFSIMSPSVNYISFADVLLLYINILTKKLLTFYAALSKDMPE